MEVASIIVQYYHCCIFSFIYLSILVRYTN